MEERLSQQDPRLKCNKPKYLQKRESGNNLKRHTVLEGYIGDHYAMVHASILKKLTINFPSNTFTTQNYSALGNWKHFSEHYFLMDISMYCTIPWIEKTFTVSGRCFLLKQSIQDSIIMHYRKQTYESYQGLQIYCLISFIRGDTEPWRNIKLSQYNL